jgi:hypothetical protein
VADGLSARAEPVTRARKNIGKGIALEVGERR